MAYNLARNSRVFVTTNLNTATGAVATSGFTPTNTWEIQVLDGFKFGQTVNSQTVQISEGGSTPVRGQRAFNTALNPVDITFSSYIRPRLNATQATAEERVLWSFLFGSVGIDGTIYNQNGVVTTATPLAASGTWTTAVRASTTAAAATITSALTLTPAPTVGSIYTIKGVTGINAMEWSGPVKITAYTAGTSLSFEYLKAPVTTAGTASPAFTTAVKFDQSAWVEIPSGTGITSCGLVTTAQSNKNQLLPFGFIFYVDGQWYTVDNCAMDQASVDFSLDAIATIAWTAKGTKLNLIDTPVGETVSSGGVVLGTSGSLSGTATAKVTTANYITNKLSTTTVKYNIDGSGSTTSFALPITGGNITFANNITYVTPANMGTLNTPIGYFTGSRAISGNLTAYLKAGTGVAATANTGDLLSKILTVSQTATETKFSLQVEVGGAANGTRVEMEVPGAMLAIPTVDMADVVSTSIGFTAQSYDPVTANNSYDIERTNDAEVRYYSI